MQINVPAKIKPVIYEKARYKILYGGRGSAKSWSIAVYILIKAAFWKVRVLCTREIQGSIRDSVYRLLSDLIYSLKLSKYFIIKNDSIVSYTGSEIIFKGLRQNISEIKSTEGVDICWVEEAEKVSKDSWDTLVPTIRKEDSEILVSFNPEDEKSETYTRFVEKDGKAVEMPDCKRAWVNWWDNPWFPQVLRREMEWCRSNDKEKYDHVWGGRPKKYGQAVIFKNKLRIEAFDSPNPDVTQYYYGADFGYGPDPTCLIKMFVADNNLYIEEEFYGYGIEITDLPRCFETVAFSRKWLITADSARPDTISYLAGQGFVIEGAEKGAGSVEDGIEFLNSFGAIVIHPRCPGSIGDFSNYRWKEDKVTGAILPIPLDKSNHSPDAARYGLERYIKGGVSIFDVMPR